MDHYANKAKNAPAPSTQQALATDTYQSPSPTWATQSDSGLQFHFDEETDAIPMQHNTNTFRRYKISTWEETED